MKLKLAHKKFNFLKKLNLDDEAVMKFANSLERLNKGDDNVLLTPLGDSLDPYDFLEGWQSILLANIDKLNDPLIKLESNSKTKFGPRSRALPYSEREQSIRCSWTNQDDKHIPKFKELVGPGYLIPIGMGKAKTKIKLSSSAGLPFVAKKSKVVDKLLSNFDSYHNRKDPCVLFTRTGENWKTRNIWGFPFADTFYDMLFYVPLLLHQRTLPWRSSLVGEYEVACKITEIIDFAISTGRIIYSIDFAGFDASVKWQYIREAFKYFASCFIKSFEEYIMAISERFYTISLVTPKGVLTGKHGVCSGSNFTNEVDSVVQAMIAFSNDFIMVCKTVIQGDDGVYTMFKEDIGKFNEKFAYAGLKIEHTKSDISSNYATFCQMLYSDDYRDENGVITPVYPSYRAITRLIFPERFTDFKTTGIETKDFYGIRGITILENCKHHPLHEELVRYVVSKEKYKLQFSDSGLISYCAIENKGAEESLQTENFMYGAKIAGIKRFKTYKLVQQIISEEKECEITE